MRVAVSPVVARELAGIDAVAREHVAQRSDEEFERRLDIHLARGAVAHGHAPDITDA